MRLSLRARVALAGAVTVGLVLVVAGIGLITAVGRDQREAIDARLAARVERLEGPDGLTRAVARGRTADVQITSTDGETLVRATGLPEPPPPLDPGYASVDLDGEPWRILTVELPGPGAGAVGQAAEPLAPLDDARAALRRGMARLAVVAVAAVAVGGWVLGGRALRPLSRLRSATEDVAADPGAGRRVPDRSGAREADELGTTLNQMLDRLDTAIAGERDAAEAARQFTANAAHELRTPLTSLTANVELLGHPARDPAIDDQLLAEVGTDAARLAHVLDALERLARGDLVPVADMGPVDLVEVVADAVDAARQRHPHVDVALTATGGSTVDGWAPGLRVLVDNLLDNAAHHGRSADGAARLEVRVDGDGRETVLRVRDHGRGLPADEREAVRGRFVRGRGASGAGSGIGLALVDQQVRSHGATMGIGDASGGGCEVTIRLPHGGPPSDG